MHSPAGGRVATSPDLVYVGSVGGMEQGIVARESDLPFHALPAAALRGRGLVAQLRASATLAVGTRAAYRLLRRLRPAAILGTGGYVCVPLFLAAWVARIPTLIYLPDVVPGLAVRWLARIATQVACNVADSLPYFGATNNPHSTPKARARGFALRPASFVVTGYPVRAELFAQDRAQCRAAFGLSTDWPVTLVFGGSRGARSINQAVATLLPDLLERTQVIHVCGREGDETWLRAAVERLEGRLQARYKLYPYLESSAETANAAPTAPSMLRAFGAADLAICRSGASTLAELPAAALPAVLVPYPYVHQDENADYLVRYGAAVKIADGAMLGTGRPQDGPLFVQVCRLLENNHERQRMAEQSRALARPDAARHLAEALLGLATRSGS